MNDTSSSSIGSLLNTSMGKKVADKVNSESAKNSCCPSMTIKQRVIGFGVCTGLGKLHWSKQVQDSLSVFFLSAFCSQ